MTMMLEAETASLEYPYLGGPSPYDDTVGERPPLSSAPEYRPINMEYVVAFVGPRGSGKSVALARTGLWSLLCDVECHSNMPVRIGDEWKQGPLESIALNTLELFSFSERLRYAYAMIDEFQLFAASRDAMTNKSRLLAWFGQQIRKRGLSIGYSVQDFNWIDRGWQYQTDIIVVCHDLFHTPWGYELSLIHI